MKELIALTVLLFAQRAVGQACTGGNVFEYGFEDKSISTLMGAPFTYCISAVCGSAPSSFTFNVRRSYASELPNQVTVFMDSVTIPDEFDPTDDPICFTATAEDNDCLDSGDTVLLEIQDPASPPANVEIADGCGSIGVQALDSDVIEFDIKEDESIVQASLGADTAEVCVDITCADGPTKRCAVLLFVLQEENGLAERQKKIGFIPEGTEEGDRVCCTFDLLDDRVIEDDDFIDLSVHVISQDTNVYGKDVKATIRVTGGPVCDVYFIGGTPEVEGGRVRLRFPGCVASVTCTAAGQAVTFAGSEDGYLFINRRTRVSIICSVNTPVTASPLTISRSVRINGERCDSHPLDKGLVCDEDGDCTLDCQGTGGVGGVNDNFICTVTDCDGGVISTTSPCTCPFSFTVAAGTSPVCVTLNPDPIAPVSCSDENTRTVSFS